jgi:cytochrome P450
VDFEHRDGGRIACPFDHHSADFMERHYEIYDELRGEAPIAWSDLYGGFWIVTSYELVRRLAVDSSSVSVAPGPERIGGILIPTPPGLKTRPLFVPGEAEGEEHDNYRLALNPHFSKQRVAELQPVIERHVAAAVDRCVAAGEFDVVNDLVAPLLAGIACEHLGLEVDDPAAFFKKMFHMVSYSGDADSQFEAIESDFTSAWQTVVSTVADRRVHPRDDVISHLTEFDHPVFTDEQVQMMTLNVILGAADTTGSLLAQSIMYLDQHRELRDKLAADHSLIRPTVEEFLRLFMVATGPARTAVKDIDIGGVHIRQGDRILLLFSSANHDPARYANPSEFDLDRGAVQHLAMGVGSHFCLGAWLAKAIATTTLRVLITRAPDYRVNSAHAECAADVSSLNHWEHVPAMAG